jgi:DNA-binding transcriptional LysR family regulator
LIVSVIRRLPFGTVLPASVVRHEIESGLVDAFQLTHIVPRRRLWAIFSTENPLNEVERRLIGFMKEAFGAS